MTHETNKKDRTGDGQGAKRMRTHTRLLTAAISSCFIGSVQAGNLPTGGVVAAGSASFNQVGNVLNVTNSNGAVINWNTFSIGSGYTTNFIQPSVSSSVLNRVLSTDPSVILGSLTSNGRVFLINPNGILVGQGATINVGQFVASTLNISNANFLANKLQFDATPGAGSVTNNGNITTPTGGSVYLVAPNVTNNGIITTPQGETLLAAGQTVTLLDTSTPGVSVEITGAEGNATNLGTIVADAGRIGIAGVLVRNSGTLNASSVVNEGGKIFLKASQDAYVDGNGRIVTTGTKGGTVDVLGNRVAVMDDASIDASGTNGGGTVLIGGDYQGKNAAIQNSTITYFGPNATVKANATDNGNGGKVIVWADDTTRAYGSIEAKGGANGGNGGFVETSGKRYLDAAGIEVNANAPKGTAGTWLLDPSTITISSGGDSYIYYGGIFNTGGSSGVIYDGDINATLNNGTSLVIETSGAGSGSGDIIANGINISPTTGTASLSLLAYSNGTSATGNISIKDSTIDVKGNLTIVAGWDGASTTSPAVIASAPSYYGSLSILAQNSSTYVHSGGNMTLKAYGDIKILGGYLGWDNTPVTVVSTGNMSVTAGGALTVAGAWGGYSNGSSASLMSGGTQSIAANEIIVSGGNTDCCRDGSGGYYGSFAVIGSFGDQNITAHNIYVTGGGNGSYADYDNFAMIQHGYQNGTTITGTGNQTINITGGGTFAIQGGSGYGTGGTLYGDGGVVQGTGVSNNYASVWNQVGSQTVTFAGGGSLRVYGGTVGTNNFAALESKGTQIIGSSTGRPDIYVNGGTGGTVINGYSATNDASISANGAQTIFGASLTMDGGGDSATYGGAFIGGGPNISINISGDVYLNGGYSNARDSDNFGSPVAIGNKDNTTVAMTVGGYFGIDGGSGTSSGVLIGSLHGTANVAIAANSFEIDSSYGGVAIGALKDAPATFVPGSVYIGSSAAIGSNSYLYVYAQHNVEIDGTLLANTSNSSGAVYVSAGGNYSGTYSTGNIHLGGASAIGGYSVQMYAAGWNGTGYSNGNITQDRGGIIAATAAGCTGDCYNTTAVTLTADGGINLAGSVVLTNGGRIRAQAIGDLSIANLDMLTGSGYAYLSSSGGALNIGSVGSLNFINGSGLSGYTGVTIDAAGDVSLDGGSRILAGSSNLYSSVANPNANVTIKTSGDLKLDNGSYIEAGNDVFLTLRGTNSVVSLSNHSTIVSDVATQVAGTTHINFTSRSSGGIVIDGAPTITTVYGGSGFFAVSELTPDNNLDITYASTSNVATNQIDQFFTNLTDPNNKKKQNNDTGNNQGNDQNGQKQSNVGQCT